MSSYLNYLVLGDELGAERVTQDDCDAIEQAGIIDRTLIPVLQTGQGWADSRKSGYTVRGEIGRNAARLVLFDENVQVAALAVALHSKQAPGVWNWIAQGQQNLRQPTSVPWAVLREDIEAWLMPEWINWWAKHVGYALMTREGW
jgi:hypothetical protein